MPRLPAAVLASLLLLIVLPGPVRAQSVEERASLEQFRDSLGKTSDTVALADLEKRMIAVAKQHRDDPIIHLRLGFVALRIGDLSGSDHKNDAGGEFDWAAELKPEWPYPWYGIGLSEVLSDEKGVSIARSFQQMLGIDPMTRAAKAFAHSTQVDPSFVRGLVELSGTALRQRVNRKIDLARNALREAAATSASVNPDVLLYRGRVEREVGDPDSALAAFWGYLDKGGKRGLGLLEVARTQFVLGRLDGQAPYFEGAAIDDSESVAGYREDLANIVDEGDLKEFDLVHGSFRAAYLQKFWAKRDQADLRARGERLREHYRRFYYARNHFRLASLNRHYDITEIFRSTSRDFDDRGVIYIRQGEPTARSGYAAPGLELNESWRYARPTGDLVFHFVAREDVQDYKLVESVYDVLGFRTAIELQQSTTRAPSTQSINTVEQLLLSRQKLSPIYNRLYTQTAGSPAGQRVAAEERALGREAIRVGTTSDSYVRTYKRTLNARLVAVAVGSDSGRPVLHIAYAIQGSSLQGSATSRGYLYPIHIRLAVADLRGDGIAVLDTTRSFMAASPVPPDGALNGQISVPVIPGDLVWHMALQQGEDAGSVTPPDTVIAADPTARGMGLSGLALGDRAGSSGMAWRPNPADTVYFSPLQSFLRSGTMEMYAEVYGLDPEVPFKSELTVQKRRGGGVLGLFGGKKKQISIKSDEHSTGPLTVFRRSIGLDKLSAGEYTLELAVTDAAGRTLRQRQPFTVMEPRESGSH
ncbi:MAG: GWxTD domain-containing protein [Gemmatimonadota bacterium]